MKINFTHCIALHKCFAFGKIMLRSLRFLFHLEFYTFSISNGYFGQIQYFFKVLKTNFEIKYFFNTSRLGTLSIQKLQSAGKPTTEREMNDCDEQTPNQKLRTGHWCLGRATRPCSACLGSRWDKHRCSRVRNWTSFRFRSYQKFSLRVKQRWK